LAIAHCGRFTTLKLSQKYPLFNARNLMKSRFLIIFLFFLCNKSVAAFPSNDAAPLFLSKDSLAKQVDITKHQWLYCAGFGNVSGDSSWASAQLDESKWLAKIGVAKLPTQDLESLQWHGIGWFRLHFRVDSSLCNSSVAVFFVNNGAAEIYLDGKRVYAIGTVGRTSAEQVEGRLQSTPLYFWLDSSAEHVLAVRYSNHDAVAVNARYAWFSAAQSTCGFRMDLVTPANALALQKKMRWDILQLSLVGGFIAALGVLYLFLYLARLNRSQQRDRANLLFSLFAFGYVLAWLLSGQVLSLMIDNNEFSIWRQIVLGCFVFDATLILLPMFLYAVFQGNFPKYFWILIALGVIDGVGQLLVQAWFENWWRIFANTAWIWSLFIVAKALRERKPDAWFVAVGVFLYVTVSVLRTLHDFLRFQREIGLAIFEWELSNTILETASQLSIPVGMALYLARRSARTNLKLSQKLVEIGELSEEKLRQSLDRERLEAENTRKSKELDEARTLQLSMLPQTIPTLDGTQIAVFMKTATEVGGDYYDFHTAPDGVLTLALGDATGHGMKAGTMVTVAKSHFQTLAEESPKTMLARMNTGIRAMRLRGVFMGLTVVKLHPEGRITLTLAGMPPALVYRAASHTVEILVLKAPPLGAFVGFAFQELETVLLSGDVLLIVSDGLTERFNSSDEQLGDERIVECFQQNATHEPQVVIDALVRLGDNWGGERVQDDDVTLLVVQIQ
jgi:serine phosphatase RsbU (regulator of sigma subunit)